jgi:hypothetical protein
MAIKKILSARKRQRQRQGAGAENNISIDTKSSPVL